MAVTSETLTEEFLHKSLQCQRDRKSAVPSNSASNTTGGWYSPQQLTSDSELIAFQKLCNAYIHHENSLLIQLLTKMGLSLDWADVILPIVHKVTDIVRPDVRNADDDMDIRNHVRFKKVPGGTKEHCRIVNGVVCTKNVAHRHMRRKLKAPKILLIVSSIDYQR